MIHSKRKLLLWLGVLVLLLTPLAFQAPPAIADQDASGWHIETVDSEEGRDTSLALDRGGYPHISYRGSNSLKYAYQDTSGWHIETMDSEGKVGYFTSLALDYGSYPHISYYDRTNEDLKYAYQDASGWHIETVYSEGQVGRHTSLALDGDGYQHISYYDYGNRYLKYVYQDASGWHVETVDSEGNAGQFGGGSPALPGGPRAVAEHRAATEPLGVAGDGRELPLHRGLLCVRRLVAGANARFWRIARRL